MGRIIRIIIIYMVVLNYWRVMCNSSYIHYSLSSSSSLDSLPTVSTSPKKIGLILDELRELYEFFELSKNEESIEKRESPNIKRLLLMRKELGKIKERKRLLKELFKEESENEISKNKKFIKLDFLIYYEIEEKNIIKFPVKLILESNENENKILNPNLNIIQNENENENSEKSFSDNKVNIKNSIQIFLEEDEKEQEESVVVSNISNNSIESSKTPKTPINLSSQRKGNTNKKYLVLIWKEFEKIKLKTYESIYKEIKNKLDNWKESQKEDIDKRLGFLEINKKYTDRQEFIFLENTLGTEGLLENFKKSVMKLYNSEKEKEKNKENQRFPRITGKIKKVREAVNKFKHLKMKVDSTENEIEDKESKEFDSVERYEEKKEEYEEQNKENEEIKMELDSSMNLSEDNSILKENESVNECHENKNFSLREESFDPKDIIVNKEKDFEEDGNKIKNKEKEEENSDMNIEIEVEEKKLNYEKEEVEEINKTKDDSNKLENEKQIKEEKSLKLISENIEEVSNTSFNNNIDVDIDPDTSTDKNIYKEDKEDKQDIEDSSGTSSESKTSSSNLSDRSDEKNKRVMRNKPEISNSNKIPSKILSNPIAEEQIKPNFQNKSLIKSPSLKSKKDSSALDQNSTLKRWKNKYNEGQKEKKKKKNRKNLEEKENKQKQKKTTNDKNSDEKNPKCIEEKIKKDNYKEGEREMNKIIRENEKSDEMKNKGSLHKIIIITAIIIFFPLSVLSISLIVYLIRKARKKKKDFY